MKILLSNVKKLVLRSTVYWFIDTKFWYKLMKYTIPFIRLTTYYPQFPKFKFQDIYEALEPGDIILTIDYQKLTTLMVPGKWSHAAVCVAKGKGKVECVEMTHDGFSKTDFHKVCSESEQVRIKRVVDPRWDVEKFIKNVWKQEGSEYNFTFRSKHFLDPRGGKPTNKHGQKVHKFNYCSQLVTEGDVDDILDINWDDLAGLGVKYISPTGLDNGKNLVTVIDSGEIER